MKKIKSTISFVCQECGYDSPQWLGKCPECGEWNSLKEFRKNDSRGLSTTNGNHAGSTVVPKTLQEITIQEINRMHTGFLEMDTVLGGGVVPGSVILLAGDPGIGKSTLLLQLALQISTLLRTSSQPGEAIPKDYAENNGIASLPRNNVINKVLYISGEESVEQIKLRASRLTNNFDNKNFLLVSLIDTDKVVEVIEQEKPSFVVIDSIQTMESNALEGLSGSVGQVRYATTQYIRVAKKLHIPIIIVGHVTKEGMVAGPMVLSHMVDVVLFLEGEKFTQTRILRSFKNRFGPVDEVGIFLMQEDGMKEVKNPEQLFLTKREETIAGSMLVVIMEGTRPFLIEIQALVVYSKLPMPRRVAVGFDYKKLELLLAVLQKQCQLSFDTMDVFVSIAGGIKVADPAIDVGICLAVVSSLKNKPFPNTVSIGEVGLLGELRHVGSLEKRIRESEKLGFRTIISAKTYKNIKNVLQ